jgi:N6-adenosine-specific RNA methylase IME4
MEADFADVAGGALVDIHYVEMCRAIDRCYRVDEIKDIRDKTLALETYARQAKNTEAERRACEIRIRAERRAGELLRDLAQAEMRVTPQTANLSGKTTLVVGYDEGPVRLADFGVTRDQSSKWQKIASIPEKQFEALLADRTEPISTARLVEQATRRNERMANLDAIARGNAPLDAIAERFPVLYVDPPWRYEHVKTESRAIENQYPTMTLDEIKVLPVSDIATPDSVLFMWATSPKLAEAMLVIDAWSFTYRTCAVWDKQRIGMGYFFRQQTEHLLVATKGAPPAPVPENRPASLFSFLRGRHSEKPCEVYEVIERMYPVLPKLELFARTHRDGWAAWGNQANGL